MTRIGDTDNTVKVISISLPCWPCLPIRVIRVHFLFVRFVAMCSARFFAFFSALNISLFFFRLLPRVPAARPSAAADGPSPTHPRPAGAGPSARVPGSKRRAARSRSSDSATFNFRFARRSRPPLVGRSGLLAELLPERGQATRHLGPFQADAANANIDEQQQARRENEPVPERPHRPQNASALRGRRRRLFTISSRSAWIVGVELRRRWRRRAPHQRRVRFQVRELRRVRHASRRCGRSRRASSSLPSCADRA